MVPLPLSTGLVLLKILEEVKCGRAGEELSSIRYITVPQHENGGFIAMVVLSAIGIVVVICIYIFDLSKLVDEINPSEIVYTTFFTLGIITGYVGVFFWALYPQNNSICLARSIIHIFNFYLFYFLFFIFILLLFILFLLFSFIFIFHLFY